MPKHKLWMKRCQRNSQEQEAAPPGPSAPQPQQAPAATSWAMPYPAAAAQLTANFGAPPLPPQLQLPAPFNAPPFAVPPYTVPQMPAALPGQNALQVWPSCSKSFFALLLLSTYQSISREAKAPASEWFGN